MVRVYCNHLSRDSSCQWRKWSLLTSLGLPLVSVFMASAGLGQSVPVQATPAEHGQTVLQAADRVQFSTQAADLADDRTADAQTREIQTGESPTAASPTAASPTADTQTGEDLTANRPVTNQPVTNRPVTNQTLPESTTVSPDLPESAAALSPTDLFGVLPSSVNLAPLATTLPDSSFAQAEPVASPPNSEPVAQDIARDYDPNAGLRIPPNAGEGRSIERVYLYVRNPSGDAIQDQDLQEQVSETFGLRAGGSFSPLFADRAINQVRQLPAVASAEYRLYESNLPGSVIVAVLVTQQSAETAAPETPPPTARGIFATGNFGDFPTLLESDRTLFKVILNGSLGIFSDSHSWFGNPQNFVAGPYQPDGTITWGEFSLEAGLAGITRLGDTPLYLYGAATYTVAGTVQPDIFRDDDRSSGGFEQLYGGLLYAERGNPVAVNLSAGRQRFQLNQGFLFSQFSGSANALERAASFLNPRTAYEMTVLADARLGDLRLRGFFLQPDELAIADSETQYLGTSLSYNNNRTLEISLSYIAVPQSERAYLLPDGQTESREGLQVINPRLRLTSLFGVQGLWVESEYAYQFSSRLSMSAHAAYLWLGYTAENSPWRPSFSYRFAGFSGDNPNTATYERFDPLQAGGLSDWLQGLSLGKVFNNSNSFSHRLSFSVQPSESFSLSLDYYYRYADQLNNLGGNRALQELRSRDIGHEIQLIARYFVSQNFLLQGVTSIAFPGAAIQRAVTGDTNPWFTFQVSLFMFF